MPVTNKKHKDRLFRMLFNDKENLLSLYNALAKTSYTNAEDLEINTIEDVIYMGMKNDISCIIDDRMALFEQQSTYNPNMPLRGFLYYAKLYEKLLGDRDVYSRKLVKIPAPVYYVLYNGAEEEPDYKILHLSDSYTGKQEEINEWSATMVNINYGHNKELMETCKTLSDYAYFVGKVREYSETMLMNEAINAAVDNCIKNGVLKTFLTGHKAEVIGMLLTEYDEKKTMNNFFKDGFDEGVRKKEVDMVKALYNRNFPIAEIADITGVSENSVSEIIQSL